MTQRVQIQPPEKIVLRCTFMNQPFISFMILILEDRAVYNIQEAVNRIKQSRFWNDSYMQRMVKDLLQSKKNRAKCGVIGKYIRDRDQMFSFDDQCRFSDVMIKYDDTIQIQDRILRKRIRETFSQNKSLSKDDINVCESVMMGIINTDMIESYYANLAEALPYVEIHMNSIPITPRSFIIAKKILDNIAARMNGGALDFSLTEGFDKAHRAYINTINNNDRMMKHFESLGIDNRVKSKYKIGIFETDKIVRVENNLVTNKQLKN